MTAGQADDSIYIGTEIKNKKERWDTDMSKITNEELAHKMMKAMFKLRESARDDRGPHGPEDGPHHGPGPEGCGHRGRGFGGPGPGPRPPFGRPGMGRRPMGRERILVILADYPDGVHQKDIMEQAGIGPSSLSELIDKLESDGYIERKTDPADKRATLLFLTEKGQARAAEVEDERNEMFKDMFKNLTDEEKQTFSDLLDKIIAE